MPDRYRAANLALPLHASSASGPVGGPESRHSAAPGLMLVPEAAPSHPERGARSFWRFGRYIAVYSVLALAAPPVASALALLAG